MAAPFMIALRGYDMGQVDAVLRQADDALASGSATLRAAARSALQSVEFRERFRGYARIEVDRAIEERLQQLA
ncbi:DivIVA domain-containing protein [Actinoplanes sp. TRM 88003]|uniref:DivIVA domain-containing protein n=1 Tax=Paractinoplanes aksuensis TaxID=2939490 RepID=A0ABT1DG70_9ACTN|nr:DivIVA domain-containing protein [Actinoplanes aksuensis]MCO8269050.1 DivIVA domain-containing protein [Actinoplanes aksuensis]